MSLWLLCSLNWSKSFGEISKLKLEANVSFGKKFYTWKVSKHFLNKSNCQKNTCNMILYSFDGCIRVQISGSVYRKWLCIGAWWLGAFYSSMFFQFDTDKPGAVLSFDIFLWLLKHTHSRISKMWQLAAQNARFDFRDFWIIRKMSAEICATCSEEFPEKWMLDAHYAGHENALKWCTEIQKIKVRKCAKK